MSTWLGWSRGRLTRTLIITTAALRSPWRSMAATPSRSRISSAPGGSGPYSYTVTRNLDGTGANTWYAGDAVFNTGTTGDGFIDLYSIRGVKAATQYGPTIVGNVRNSATYNDWTECWAIGNLNGLYGYGVDTYGVGLGKYSEADYVTIDPTNGIRFLDAADVVQAQLSSSVWTLGRVAASFSNVQITAGALKLRTNTTDHVELTTAGTFWAGDTATSERLQWDTTNGLQIFNASNVAVLTAGTSGDMSITGVLTIGTAGGIYQGTGTFASPTTGLKVWREATTGIGQIAGYNSGTVQWYADTDGKLYASAVRLDADGISIACATDWHDTNAVKFYHSDATEFVSWYTTYKNQARTGFYTDLYTSTNYVATGSAKNCYLALQSVAAAGYIGSVAISAAVHRQSAAGITLYTQSTTTAYIDFYKLAGVSVARLDCINVRLGIGTDAPDYTLDVAGNAGFDEYLYHNGDADTYQRYQADRWTVRVGGVDMLDVVESTTDYITISGYVGIGSAPTDEYLYIALPSSSTPDGIVVKQGNTSDGVWQKMLQILNKSSAERFCIEARGSDGQAVMRVPLIGNVADYDAVGVKFLTSGNAAQVIQVKAVMMATTYGDISALNANTLYGSNASGGSLTLEPTSHATKGSTLINPNGGRVGIYEASPAAQLDVAQPGTTAAIPVLQLHQSDVDQPFIDFQGGTVYTGKTAVDEYLMVKVGANTRYIRLYS